MSAPADVRTKRLKPLVIVSPLVPAMLHCLPSFELPDEPVIADVACGEEGQACCPESSTPCNAELRCDAASRLCLPDEQRHCVSDEQCRSGQTCCVSGVIGSCVSLGPNAQCPIADLQIVTTPATLSLSSETRVFDPESSTEDACAIEKGCVGGAGARQLLHFSTAIFNAGGADLILGTPSQAPFATAACDGTPYLPRFLAYSLVDVRGRDGSRRANAGAVRWPTRAVCFALRLWLLWHVERLRRFARHEHLARHGLANIQVA